jgi:hypothetical protein
MDALGAKAPARYECHGPGPVSSHTVLRRRAAHETNTGATRPRRHQCNAEAAPVFPAQKKESRSARGGPALQLANEEKVPSPVRKERDHDKHTARVAANKQ